MKSVVVTAYGGPEVLEVRDTPIPEPEAGMVRIAVKAAGVNYADIMQRRGLYPDGPEPPFGAGFEVAGVVDAVGEGISQWKEGDAVMAFCEAGYSEYVLAPAQQVMPKPEQVDFRAAVALPCQGLTAYHALFTLGGLEAGQTVLLQAAAGGLGTLMVQMARNAGATVFGTASTDEKCALIGKLGCTHPIQYTREDFEERVKQETDGAGCDLVIETVGGPVLTKSLHCLKMRGMLVTLGVASGDVTPINPVELLANNWIVAGFHLFGYTQDAAAMANAMRDVHNWLLDGTLDVVTEHTFALDEAAQAHQSISERKSRGKVALIP